MKPIRRHSRPTIPSSARLRPIRTTMTFATSVDRGGRGTQRWVRCRPIVSPLLSRLSPTLNSTDSRRTSLATTERDTPRALLLGSALVAILPRRARPPVATRRLRRSMIAQGQSRAWTARREGHLVRPRLPRYMPRSSRIDLGGRARGRAASGDR